MKTILRELIYSAARVLKLYGSKKTDDIREKECLNYVETRRQRTNIRRSMLFALLLAVMNLVALIVPVTRAAIAQPIVYMMAISVVLLIVYIEISGQVYQLSEEDFKKPSERRKASSLYVTFWTAYYIMIATSVGTFADKIQGIVLWMVLVFIVLSVPMFNRVESIVIVPAGAVSFIICIRVIGIGLPVILTCAPILLLLLVIAQTNHLEKLESYYDTAKNHTESLETKRRLSKVFEEVFDLAFEFDIRNDSCDVLRTNDRYGLTENNHMTIGAFFEQIAEIAHPDDVSLCSRNFNLDYLNEEFLLGRSQIYFEVRLRNVDEEYNWVSILITKESDLESGSYILCLIQDIEERKRNEDKLRLEAEKDPLTQLYNKMTTKSLIEECLEKNSSSQHALIIIDIDNFKTINDTKGHVVGDQILLAFASELNKNFRETDILGRAGGDEFIVLIKNVQSIAMVCDKLQRLTSSFKKYGIDHGFPGRLSTSIGVSMFNKDGKTYEELFKKADAALYEAKRNGKDQYKFSISRT